jgi:hypothetical protein
MNLRELVLGTINSLMRSCAHDDSVSDEEMLDAITNTIESWLLVQGEYTDICGFLRRTN